MLRTTEAVVFHRRLKGVVKGIQIHSSDSFAFGSVYSPFHNIFQFPDIAGPLIVHKNISQLFGELRDFHSSQFPGHSHGEV